MFAEGSVGKLRYSRLEKFGSPREPHTPSPPQQPHTPPHHHLTPAQLAVSHSAREPQLTVRAVGVGLVVGSLLCFINVYFGLQTGWVTMGSIQCAVVGYAILNLPLFNASQRRSRFTSRENVVLQTVGVATATIPLAGGFVGIIPALSMLDPPVVLSVGEQLAWAAALTYFGAFFAVPLRRQASLAPLGLCRFRDDPYEISVLCTSQTILEEQLTFPSGTATAKLIETLHAKYEGASGSAPSESEVACAAPTQYWVARLQLPFSSQRHRQGMIMRQRPAFSMLAGAVTAWAVLGPMARRNGWATGEIDSWEDGAQVLPTVFHPAVLVVIAPGFDLPVWQVRALGQTDLNPVSAIGKISQVVFAVIAPGHVVANIVAGAIAEAGATQAGDLLQDLKTGHLLGCSPRALFIAQLFGASTSIFVTVGAYQMYDQVYGIPSPQFTAPVAHVWKDMAILMQKGTAALPPSAVRFASYFAVAGAVLPVIEKSSFLVNFLGPLLPSGVAFGVGMYVTPDWTIPRATVSAPSAAGPTP
ncbi:MAG: hypothetical protein SGPRY_002861 [Prymnesium sp.]